MIGLIITLSMAGMFFIASIILLIDGIKTKDISNIICGIVFAIISGIFAILIISEMKNIQTEPTAIDVYRGLTELEITSVNGVPKDTVVVFKNK